MTHTIEHESIAMMSLRWLHFPYVFVWRNRRHVVTSVDRNWRDGGRECFAVRCGNARHTLYKTAHGEWRIETKHEAKRRPLRELIAEALRV